MQGFIDTVIMVLAAVSVPLGIMLTDESQSSIFSRQPTLMQNKKERGQEKTLTIVMTVVSVLLFVLLIARRYV